MNTNTNTNNTPREAVADAVNHPNHYQGNNGIEAIDVIEAFNLNFRLGNAVKYILRAGHKNADPFNAVSSAMAALEDLRKAEWYIKRELALVQDDIVAMSETVGEEVE